MNRVIRLVCLIVFLFFSLTGCHTSEEENSSHEEELHIHSDELVISNDQIEEMQIEIISFDSTVFYHKIQTTGRVEVPPQHSAKVSAYFEGYVKNIFPYAGESVEKGQKLFVLENPKYLEIQRDYLESRAVLAMLEADFKRQSYLREDNVTSQKNFAKVQAEFEVAKARHQSLKKTLEMMHLNPDRLTSETIGSEIVVRAPISGNLKKVEISIGVFLQPSDIAMEIVNLDHPHIELVVLEKDLSSIREQQEIVFQLQNGTTKKYKAEVHLVNRTIDEDSRTASIHGHLLVAEDAMEMSSGMFVEAEVLSEKREVVAIREESVVEIDQRFFVLQLISEEESEKHFQTKEILIGKTFDGKIEILNSVDFSKGSRFLGRGAFSLLNDGSNSGHSH
jgi:membrane fusion protein, heavy metal efflux system